MKKLMIALTAVAMAAGVQAATVDWEITASNSMKDHNNSTIAASQNMMAYFCLQSSVADLVNNAAAITATSTGVLSSSGVGDKGEVTTMYDATSDSLSLTEKNKLSVIIVDKSTDGQVWYEYATPAEIVAYNEKDAEATHTTAQFTYKSFRTSNGGSGWIQAQAVPEPTSGLLLLLGVAGLALRRRRA